MEKRCNFSSFRIGSQFYFWEDSYCSSDQSQNTKVIQGKEKIFLTLFMTRSSYNGVPLTNIQSSERPFFTVLIQAVGSEQLSLPEISQQLIKNFTLIHYMT